MKEEMDKMENLNKKIKTNEKKDVKMKWKN